MGGYGQGRFCQRAGSPSVFVDLSRSPGSFPAFCLPSSFTEGAKVHNHKAVNCSQYRCSQYRSQSAHPLVGAHLPGFFCHAGVTDSVTHGHETVLALPLWRFRGSQPPSHRRRGLALIC